MNKPKNWEKTQAYGEFEPLELGGHICKIMSVEETQSRSGKDMLVISLDIADGPQKGYYADQYKKDFKPDKKWGCIVYQLEEDKDGNANRGLKTFIKAVGESNPDFAEDKIWGSNDLNPFFKGKSIGGVFGREQYKNQNGDLKWSIKCVQFRSVEDIKKGVDIPEDKYLKEEIESPAAGFDINSFEEFDENDSELPF